jgi:hypothetical protein
MKPTHHHAIIAACLVLSSCKESAGPAAAEPSFEEKIAAGPESAATEVAKLQEELAVVMESVTDVTTAEQAIPKLGPIAEKFAAAAKAAQGMDKNLSPETDAKLKQLLKPSQDRLSAAMDKAMPILAANPEVAQKMQDAMAKMQPPQE